MRWLLLGERKVEDGDGRGDGADAPSFIDGPRPRGWLGLSWWTLTNTTPPNQTKPTSDIENARPAQNILCAPTAAHIQIDTSAYRGQAQPPYKRAGQLGCVCNKNKICPCKTAEGMLVKILAKVKIWSLSNGIIKGKRKRRWLTQPPFNEAPSTCDHERSLELSRQTVRMRQYVPDEGKLCESARGGALESHHLGPLQTASSRTVEENGHKH